MCEHQRAHQLRTAATWYEGEGSNRSLSLGYHSLVYDGVVDVSSSPTVDALDAAFMA